MDTNHSFVRYLQESGVLHTPLLIEAFLKCDRFFFVPEMLRDEAYGDYPLPIGEGQTISQPTTVAYMLELLSPQKGERVLDIGSGSGWTTALLAYAVGTTGSVIGLERISSLVALGKKNLEQSGITNASIETADPTVLGKPGELFDRILVSASAIQMPTQLIKQLKPGGILVLPVQNSLWKVTKHIDKTIDAYEIPGFMFVPLIVKE